MKKNVNYQYYVEGEDEKKLLDVLKRDLIKCTNLDSRLRKCSFNISKFWSKVPDNKFQTLGNDSDKIRL